MFAEVTAKWSPIHVSAGNILASLMVCWWNYYMSTCSFCVAHYWGRKIKQLPIHFSLPCDSTRPHMHIHTEFLAREYMQCIITRYISYSLVFIPFSSIWQGERISIIEGVFVEERWSVQFLQRRAWINDLYILNALLQIWFSICTEVTINCFVFLEASRCLLGYIAKDSISQNGFCLWVTLHFSPLWSCLMKLNKSCYLQFFKISIAIRT